MSFASWLKTRKTHAKHIPIRHRTFAPRLEPLEDRLAPATFSVVNTLNSGVGSLRQAILDSNASVGVADTINFEIGAGIQTIAPTAALPTITDPVAIDGTAPAALPTQKVELSGASAGSSNGLAITAGNSTVRGLTINRFGLAGIDLRTGGFNRVEGCILGLDPTGTIDRGNGQQGLNVFNSPDNVIGGTAPGAGNVISGNFSGITFGAAATQRNQVLGNFIGTNAAGTAAIPNSIGINVGSFAANTTVGGSDPAARNVISGNSNGVLVSTRDPGGTVIVGNYIGTDFTGTIDLGNAVAGVFVGGGSGLTRIGGTAPGERNVISGNNTYGVRVDSDNTQVLGNYIGTDATGTAPLGNGSQATDSGVWVPGQLNILIRGNVISANAGYGVHLQSNPGTLAVRIEGNRIGTSADGTADLGNRSHGVRTSVPGPSNHRIGGTGSGEGNLIAYNDGAGVFVSHQNSRGVAILGNSIFANDGLGIDLATSATGSAVGVTPNDAGDADGGANALQNFPVLSTVTSSGSGTTIAGTLNSTANTTFRLEFYSNLAGDPTGFGEGQMYLEFIEVTTDAAGNVAFTATVPDAVSSAHFVTATATRLVDHDANAATPLVVQETSEFSQGKNPVLLNSPPSADAGPDQAAPEGATVSFDDTGSSDPDGDALTYFWDFGDGATGTGPTPTHVYADNGTYVVALTVEDGNGGSSSDSLTVSVNNVAPAAVDDSATTDEDQAVRIAVLANDSDAAGANDPLRIDSVTSGSKGTTAIDDKGTPDTTDDEILYTPNPDANGSDSFTYTISDGDGGSATATVTVTITPVNDAPVASDDSASLTEDDASVSGNVLSNDTDVDDGTTLVVASPGIFNGTYGDLTLGSDGAYSYAFNTAGVQHLAQGASVTDSFSYQASDGIASSASATLTVTIIGVNDAPIITSNGGGDAAALSVPENTTAVTTVTAADPDAGATLTFAISGGADAGKFTIDAGTGALRFITAPDFETPADVGANNVYEVQVQVSDGTLADTQTIAVTVTDLADRSPVYIGQGCCDPRALVVQGTEGNDRVRIVPQGCGGGVKVVFNGTEYVFAAGSFTSIVVHGNGGDDTISVAGAIDKHACLFGGTGNDLLQAGAGDDVLVGGDGDDTLAGRQGRDLLIGGRGADRIVGNADDDILIAGTTDHDTDGLALCAIMAEWTRCDLGYAQRVAHLRHGGGLNGGVRLNDTTVHDDGACDRLTGSAGRDWFFANLDCGVRDIVTDDRCDEFTIDVD